MASSMLGDGRSRCLTPRLLDNPPHSTRRDH
jgi:hypothetical protein